MNENIPDSWEVPAHETRIFRARAHRHALVVPVVNEGERIRRQLEAIAQARLPVDVVIADGGSTDGSLTDDLLIRTDIRALLVKTGPGRLSAQLRMAYAFCLREGYEGIVTVDGNGKDGIEAVSAFVEKLDAGYDYVQGSRYARGGAAVNTPVDRAFGNRFIHAPLLSLAGRARYTDTTNGFRAYSARYLLDERVLPFRSVFQAYELLFYLTVRAGRIGLKTCEIGVVRRYPSGSVPTKIAGLRGKLAILRQTVAAALGLFDPR